MDKSKRRIEYWTGDRCPLVQQAPGQSHTLRSHSVYDWSIFAHSNKLYHSVKETLQVLRCLWEKKTQKKKRNRRESSQDHDFIKNHSKKKKKGTRVVRVWTPPGRERNGL